MAKPMNTLRLSSLLVGVPPKVSEEEVSEMVCFPRPNVPTIDLGEHPCLSCEKRCEMMHTLLDLGSMALAGMIQEGAISDETLQGLCECDAGDCQFSTFARNRRITRC
jgi:hypothetical protein